MQTEIVLQNHLAYLCHIVGSRMAGTEQNLQAAAYIRQIFREAGLHVQQQRFDCPTWQVRHSTLSVNGEQLPCLVNPFSPPCDITAKIAVVRTMAELQATSLDNRICVLVGDLSKETLSYPSNPVFVLPHHKAVAEQLKEKAPTAVIAVSLSPGYRVPIIEDPDFGIPSVTISAETGLRLVQGGETAVSLTVDSSITEGHAFNIIGSNGVLADRRIVLTAHYDTKPYTTGGFDNGSSIATLLALAQRLTVLDLQIDLEFVAFGGEEYAQGGDTYLEQFGLQIVPFGSDAPHQPSDLDNVLLAINFDGIGAWLGADTVAVMSASAQLEETVRRVTHTHKGMLLVDPWPASNHYDFYTHHVPTVAMSSVGMTNLIHHERDTTAWISSAKLAEVMQFVEELILAIQDKPLNWAR